MTCRDFSRVVFVIVGCALVFCLSGCGGGGDGLPMNSVTRNVGPEGGAVVLDDLTLEIPAGALDGATVIRITALEGAPGGYAVYSPVYSFEPEGQIFKKPARLSMPFDGDAVFATMFWSKQGEPGFERLDTTNSDGIATAFVSHFSNGFVCDERVCGITDNGNGTHTITCNDGTSATLSDGKDGKDGTSCTVGSDGGTTTISCTDGTSVAVKDGADGTDGSSCSVTDNGDGTKTVACTDGTSVTVSDGAAGKDGTNGTDGSSCSVTDNGDGTRTVACTDGTSVTVSNGANGQNGTDGQDGTSCTVTDNGNGVKTISCTDGTSVTVSDGTNGQDGTSCTVTDNGDGTKTISCTDGTSVTVTDGVDGQNGTDGQDGTSCTVMDNGNGTKTISCTDGTSVTVSDGTNGQDGTSCTVTDNGDGTKTILCMDGTSVTVTDGVNGQNGTDGQDGTSCTVADNGDGTKTISCTDGTSATVTDGVNGQNGTDGQDGTSCTVTDNGDGTKTISCTDGSSATVVDGSAASCTVTDHGDGTATLACPDGTSVTFGTSSGGGDVLEGSFVINNTFDVATFLNYREITGNLVIDATGLTTLTLPNLQKVGGRLSVIGSTLTQLAFPILEVVEGGLLIEGSAISALSLPELQRIGGRLSVSGAALTQLTLPILGVLEGDVLIEGPAITALSLPELLRIGGNLWLFGGALTQLTLPILEVVEGDLGITSPLGALELPMLGSIGGEFSINSTTLPTLILERLASVGGIVVGPPEPFWIEPDPGAYALDSISFPSLTTCGIFHVFSVPLSQGISVPLLRSITDLTILSTWLTSLRLDQVASAANITVSGSEIVSLELPVLTSMSGELSLAGPKLASVDLNALETVGSLRINPMAMTTFTLSGLRSAGEIWAQGYCDYESPSGWELGKPEVVSLPELQGALEYLSIYQTGTCDGNIGGYYGKGPGLRTVHLPKITAISTLVLSQNSALELLDVPLLTSVQVQGQIVWNPSFPQCLIEDFLARGGWTDYSNVYLNREDCTCGGEPLVASCCEPDHLACCGTGVCWVDTCGKSGEVIEACSLACLDGACVTCEAAGMAECMGECKPLGTSTDCSACGDVCQVDQRCNEGICGVIPSERQIPAGSFWMGCNTAVDDYCEFDESPYHEVTLSGYYIDTMEVTVSAYGDCVTAGGCTAPTTGSFCNWGVAGKDNHPVNCVDWTQATAYCTWAGKRLPTEAEWEKAARGTDGRKYPWGNETATCHYAVMFDGDHVCGGGEATSAVCEMPAGDSPYGLCDMSGNVWEWVSDWYDSGYYADSPSSNPTGPDSSWGRVVRGGAYDAAPSIIRVSKRLDSVPSYAGDNLGFRCARDAL